jgi:hypothetical protein
LPLYPDAEAKIKANLRTAERGAKPTLVAIGTFTDRQWTDINAVRRGLGLHEIESKEIVFLGRHFYASRAKDGYTVDDMCTQINAALSDDSVAFANPKMTALESPQGRTDGRIRQHRAGPGGFRMHPEEATRRAIFRDPEG